MRDHRALTAFVVLALLSALLPLPPALAQVAPTADVAITKTDGSSYYVPGETSTYTITVTNAGPSDALGVQITDTLPASISSSSAWTAVFAGGATGTASGSGSIAQSVNMPAGSTVTYTLAAAVFTTATGVLTNTATATATGTVTDPNPANNTASDTDQPSVDLQVTMRDYKPAYTPGLANVYTLLVTNAGNETVTGIDVASAFTEQVGTINWVAAFSGVGSTGTASGIGDVAETIALGPGGTATYTITADTYEAATGSLIAVGTIDGGSVFDSTPSNNIWPDIDVPLRVADLAITKTDNATTCIPGATTVYTVVVRNNGPSIADGAVVTDALPDGIASASWTAVFEGAGSTGTASGTGDIDETISLSAEGTATYTITAAVASTATGNLFNTATVSAPVGTLDLDVTNNSSTDCDAATPQVCLDITMTDGSATYTPGRNATYTITVTNSGPSFLAGGRLADALPTSILAAMWTAVYTGEGSEGPASGTGDIDATFDLAAAGTATFTVIAPVRSSATGDLVNTAFVHAPAGTTNTNATDWCTDTDTWAPSADLRVFKSDSTSQYVPNSAKTYSITVANFGPSDVSGAQVIDVLPVMLSSASWTAVFTNGSGATSGTGNINETIDLVAGGSVTYTLNTTVASGATGNLVNSVTVLPPAAVTDPDLSNNISTDTDTLWVPGTSLAVYRFYNVNTGTHFYTASASECDYVRATWPTIFRYEGVAYHTPNEPGTVPLYRFYNLHTGTHFYTSSEQEKANVIGTLGATYRFEGVAYEALQSPTPGCVPVYRFYNRTTGAHFYTAGEEERITVVTRYPQFTLEGIAFFVAP